MQAPQLSAVVGGPLWPPLVTRAGAKRRQDPDRDILPHGGMRSRKRRQRDVHGPVKGTVSEDPADGRRYWEETSSSEGGPKATAAAGAGSMGDHAMLPPKPLAGVAGNRRPGRHADRPVLAPAPAPAPTGCMGPPRLPPAGGGKAGAAAGQGAKRFRLPAAPLALPDPGAGIPGTRGIGTGAQVPRTSTDSASAAGRPARHANVMPPASHADTASIPTAAKDHPIPVPDVGVGHAAGKPSPSGVAGPSGTRVQQVPTCTAAAVRPRLRGRHGIPEGHGESSPLRVLQGQAVGEHAVAERADAQAAAVPECNGIAVVAASQPQEEARAAGAQVPGVRGTSGNLVRACKQPAGRAPAPTPDTGPQRHTSPAGRAGGRVRAQAQPKSEREKRKPAPCSGGGRSVIKGAELVPGGAATKAAADGRPAGRGKAQAAKAEKSKPAGWVAGLAAKRKAESAGGEQALGVITRSRGKLLAQHGGTAVL